MLLGLVLSVLPLGRGTECLWLLQAERWCSHGTPWPVTQGARNSWERSGSRRDTAMSSCPSFQVPKTAPKLSLS